MKTRNKLNLGISLCLILWTSSIVLAIPLTADDMYLDPSLVPADYYDYDYYTAGHTAYFANVQSLQVLPPLTADGSVYYFTPTVDYTGDITNTNGSITFIRPGPYFVLVTYTNETTELFDYGIEFLMQGDNDKETYNWRQIETPSPDVVVVDPNPYQVKNPNPPPATLTKSLKDSQPDFPAGTTEVNILNTWEQVINYLKTLTNKHVELSGHGNKGKFFWNGTEIPITDFAQLRGHVNYLTFMSCLTGAGPEGYAFLSTIAIYLGQSGGYTDCVGGNGKEWFINNYGSFRPVRRICAFNPTPADGATAESSLANLSWTNPEPNLPGEPISCDVYFGTEPNRSDMDMAALGNDIETAALTADYFPRFVPLIDQTTYYWVVDCHDTVTGLIPGEMWYFYVDDNEAPVVDAGADQYLWLNNAGDPASATAYLDGTVSDDEYPAPYTVLWEQVSGPETLLIDPNDMEDVTILLPQTGTYEFKLTADDGDKSTSDSVQVIVRETACEAAQAMPGYEPIHGDFNSDCYVSLTDFAVFADNWLECNSLEPCY